METSDVDEYLGEIQVKLYKEKTKSISLKR